MRPGPIHPDRRTGTPKKPMWLLTRWRILVAAYGPPQAANRAYRKLTDTDPGRWT